MSIDRGDPDGDVPGLTRPLPHRGVATRARDWIAWFGAGRLAVCALSVMAVGAGGFWLLRTPAAPVEASLPMAHGASTVVASTVATATTPLSATGPPMPTSTQPAQLIVHVAGAVVSPGVYTLPSSARVVDAVAAAGGVAADADSDAINQAEPLHDGDRVYVPRLDEDAPIAIGVTPGAPDAATTATDATAISSQHPLDLNEADAAQLDLLPGIGPATAAAIVAYRDEHGPFASVDDLADVRGIGPAKLDALRGLVVT